MKAPNKSLVKFLITCRYIYLHFGKNVISEYLRADTACLMFTAIIRNLCIRSKQWFKHPGWHLKLSFNNFIVFVDFFAVFVLFCSFFLIEIKKGCPQTVTGLSSADVLAPVLRVSLGLVIVVTLESSGPIDYIASIFVHKSCISPFHNQVSDEAVDSITTGIPISLKSYKKRVSLGERHYQTAFWDQVYMHIRCTCIFAPTED